MVTQLGSTVGKFCTVVEMYVPLVRAFVPMCRILYSNTYIVEYRYLASRELASLASRYNNKSNWDEADERSANPTRQYKQQETQGTEKDKVMFQSAASVDPAFPNETQ